VNRAVDDQVGVVAGTLEVHRAAVGHGSGEIQLGIVLDVERPALVRLVR